MNPHTLCCGGGKAVDPSGKRSRVFRLTPSRPADCRAARGPFHCEVVVDSESPARKVRGLETLKRKPQIKCSAHIVAPPWRRRTSFAASVAPRWQARCRAWGQRISSGRHRDGSGGCLFPPPGARTRGWWGNTRARRSQRQCPPPVAVCPPPLRRRGEPAIPRQKRSQKSRRWFCWDWFSFWESS